MTPTIEYINFLVEGLIDPSLSLCLPVGFCDEPRPMTLSRYLWLMSGQSQRLFEAAVLAFGKN